MENLDSIANRRFLGGMAVLPHGAVRRPVEDRRQDRLVIHLQQRPGQGAPPGTEMALPKSAGLYAWKLLDGGQIGIPDVPAGTLRKGVPRPRRTSPSGSGMSRRRRMSAGTEECALIPGPL